MHVKKYGFYFFSCINLLLLTFVTGYGQISSSLKTHVEVIRKQGKPPVAFVNEVLETHDLVVFDDALHNAYEPFVFYRQLIKDPFFQQKVRYVFIEVFSITLQPYINDYFNSPVKDSSILLKVFQDDFSGYGWRHQTYLDLFSNIWDVNQKLPIEKRIKVIGVDQPVYWEAIHTRRDYDLFQESLAARDYFMYKMITASLENFSGTRKGIFLTNTRHAYKGIKNKKGDFYWNAATFLHQFHPGKIFSVRIHNVSLFIEQLKNTTGTKTTQGLDKYSYKWEKMANGTWDSAFAACGNKPVAIPLAGNAFGQSAYIGNHMLNVQEGQTIQDAYDAVIFIAPLEQLHFSASLDFIYTPAFITELKRRVILLHNNNTDELLKKEGVSTIEEFIKAIGQYKPVSKNELLRE